VNDHEPLWYRWNGAAMMPTRPELAERQFVVDGHYLLEAHHERAYKRHRAYFASLHEAWASLNTDDFATSEHLRKFALIKTGWRDERTLLCASHEEAARVAAFSRPPDNYATLPPRDRCCGCGRRSRKAIGPWARDAFYAASMTSSTIAPT
jgi:hypothetical protein